MTIVASSRSMNEANRTTSRATPEALATNEPGWGACCEAGGEVMRHTVTEVADTECPLPARPWIYGHHVLAPPQAAFPPRSPPDLVRSGPCRPVRCQHPYLAS